MAMNSNEDYYTGDFGEQINRSDALDDSDDMMHADDKPGDMSGDAETTPVPSAEDADNAFRERLSTERTNRDDSSTEMMPEMDDSDEPDARDIRE